MKPNEVRACRFCGASVADLHHIVWRSLKRDDDERNLMPVCREHHSEIHAKELDVLGHLTLEEQGYAASLIGIARAHRLLAPSVYRAEAERRRQEARFVRDCQAKRAA